MFRNLYDKVQLNLLGAYKSAEEQIWDRHKALRDIPVGGSEDGSRKTIVITGGNRGIGLEAVKKFLVYNYHVIIGCRNPEGCEETINEWLSGLNGVPGTFKAYKLDLLSLESVEEFAQKIKGHENVISALVNNAGIMFGARKETAKGFEHQFMTNYLAHFYLTILLKERLVDFVEECRIVNVSSCAHHVGYLNFDDLQSKNSYSAEGAYGASKAAQIMFTKYYQKLIDKQNLKLKVFAIHPGVVLTDLYTNVLWVRLFRFFAWILMKTPEQGGDTIVHAALSLELKESKGGEYLENSTVTKSSDFTSDEGNQEKLWKQTLKILNLNK